MTVIVSVDLPPVMAARLQEEADIIQEPLEQYLKLLIAQAMPKPRNGNELVDRLTEAGILGMWADREDIGNNLEFARQLRIQAEMRSSEV
jgi:alkylation response protein AidB-like acyl-CoA dehydrogenase